MSEIKLPKREIEIFSFELINIEEILVNLIKEKIMENIKLVNGDFRQDEIINKWNNLFKLKSQELFTVASFSISCSSGTYIRSLAHELGEKIGLGAIALDILRTKVGEHTLSDSIKL